MNTAGQALRPEYGNIRVDNSDQYLLKLQSEDAITGRWDLKVVELATGAEIYSLPIDRFELPFERVIFDDVRKLVVLAHRDPNTRDIRGITVVDLGQKAHSSIDGVFGTSSIDYDQANGVLYLTRPAQSEVLSIQLPNQQMRRFEYQASQGQIYFGGEGLIMLNEVSGSSEQGYFEYSVQSLDGSLNTSFSTTASLLTEPIRVEFAMGRFVVVYTENGRSVRTLYDVYNYNDLAYMRELVALNDGSSGMAINFMDTRTRAVYHLNTTNGTLDMVGTVASPLAYDIYMTGESRVLFTDLQDKVNLQNLAETSVAESVAVQCEMPLIFSAKASYVICPGEEKTTWWRISY